MLDAVIDEQRGRRIRIGDHWLTDWASCNYLGFDLDAEIIAAIPEYLARWGTHPSWSRLLGNPRPYEEIEEQMTALLGCEDVLLLPTITHIHMSVIPILAGEGTIFLDGGRTRRSTTVRWSQRGAARKSCGSATTMSPISMSCSPQSPGTPADRDRRRELDDRQRAGPRRVRRVAGEHDALLYVDDAHGFGVIGERSPDELCATAPRATACSGTRTCLRQRRARRRVLEVLLVAARVPCPADPAERRAQGARASVPLLRPVAGRVARDDDRRPRGQPQPRRLARFAMWQRCHACSTRWSGCTSSRRTRAGSRIIEIPLADHDEIDDVGRYLFERGSTSRWRRFRWYRRTRSGSGSR